MTTIQQSRPQELSAVLDRAVDAMTRRRAADRDLLVAALEWARSHPASSAHDVAGWGEVDLYDEGFLPLAGEGAPLVAEFAPCELAAALGWSTEAAKRLMADALELGTRLPRLWRLVCELAVPAPPGTSRRRAHPRSGPRGGSARRPAPDPPPPCPAHAAAHQGPRRRGAALPRPRPRHRR